MTDPVEPEQQNLSDPHPPLMFKRLGLNHVPRVLLLERECYPDPWTHGMFLQELENVNSHFFVAYLDETIIGYGGFWLLIDEAHVTRVTVNPAYRRRGYGTDIMRYLMDQAYQAGAVIMRLEVRETNIPAQKMYKKLGFVTEGRRPGYYQSTGEAAILMAYRF